MVASTTQGTHNPTISAQTLTNRLREISERPPYTMNVLYAAFLFWPSICTHSICFQDKSSLQCICIYAADIISRQHFQDKK